jgi:hypothetical protein
VTLSTLSRYVRQYGRHQAVPAETSRLVSVELVPDRSTRGGELLLMLSGGRRIEVRRGFDAGTLEQLIRVLERL